MPYTTPPTFVDTNILSAADLNILSDNQEWFAGIAGGPNPGIVSQSTTGGVDFFMVFRNRQRYLNFKYTFVGGSGGDYMKLWIKDNGGSYIQIFEDDPPGAGTTEYVDLTATKLKYEGEGGSPTGPDINGGSGLALTAGNWYSLKIESGVSSGGGDAETFIMDWLFNTDGTSI
jgi:hypothetical protein